MRFASHAKDEAEWANSLATLSSEFDAKAVALLESRNKTKSDKNSEETESGEEDEGANVLTPEERKSLTLDFNAR